MISRRPAGETQHDLRSFSGASGTQHCHAAVRRRGSAPCMASGRHAAVTPPLPAVLRSRGMATGHPAGQLGDEETLPLTIDVDEMKGSARVRLGKRSDAEAAAPRRLHRCCMLLIGGEPFAALRRRACHCLAIVESCSDFGAPAPSCCSSARHTVGRVADLQLRRSWCCCGRRSRAAARASGAEHGRPHRGGRIGHQRHAPCPTRA